MADKEKTIHWRVMAQGGAITVPDNALISEIDDKVRDAISVFTSWNKDESELTPIFESLQLFHCVILITDEDDGDSTLTLTFTIIPGSKAEKDPETALRSAVRDYLESGSKESQNEIKNANGYYNWGDAALTVPEEYFIIHGLRPLKNKSVEIIVDHNEVLTGSDR